MGDGRGAHRVLVGKVEEKTPTGRTRRKWKDNFKTNVKEFSWKGMEETNQALDKDKCSCKHGYKHSGSITRGKFYYLRNKQLSMNDSVLWF